MKKWFVILLLLPLLLCAAPVKLALLGERSLCDQAMVELSENDSFELLERSEIDKVMREHQLSSSNLSAGVLKHYFPHTDLFAVLTEKRLVVFHAKNGFRLWDGSPENAAEKILAAKNKLAQEEPLYLSIVSVRDVGVPLRLKAKIEEFVTLFEQELMTSPAIQMLERARLDAVNVERELAGTTFALTPSARLLTLEFESGSEATIVNLKLIVRDLGNKKLTSFDQPDVFNRLPKAVPQLQQELVSFLLKRQSEERNVQNEAERFFAEYQAATSLKEKKEKLAAALALAPMNEKYRYEELNLDGSGWENHIEHLKRCEEKYPAFRRDFPQSSRFLAETISPERYINSFNTASEAQMKWLAAYCDRIRPWHDAELRRELPFDTDNITSLREMRNFEQYTYRRSNMVMYWDFERGHQAKYEGVVKQIKTLDEFIKKYPAHRIEGNRGLFNVSQLDWHRNWQPETYDRFIRYLRSITGFHKLAEATELPGAHAASAILRAQLRLLEADSPEKRHKVYWKMYEEFDQIEHKFGNLLGLLKPGNFVFRWYFSEINSVKFEIHYPKDPAAEVLSEYLARKSGKSSFTKEQFTQLNSEYRYQNPMPHFQKMAGLTTELCSQRSQRLTVAKAAAPFSTLAQQIFEQNRDKLDQRYILEIIDGLNPAFDVRFFPYNDSDTRCYGVLQLGTSLFLLTRGSSGNGNLMLVEVDEKLRFRPVAEIPELKTIENTINDTSCFYYRMAGNDTHILIVGKTDLIIIDRRTRRQNRLSELWGDWYVTGTALHGNRVYITAQDKRTNLWGKIMMKSFALDGSGQKTIFHSERSDKRSEFDGIAAGMILGFRHLPDGKIVFQLRSLSLETKLNSRRVIFDKLLLFDPESETFREAAPGMPLPRETIRWNDVTETGKLLISGGVFCEMMLEVDPENSTWQTLFVKEKELMKQKPRYDLTGYRMVAPQFLLDGNFLWFGGELPGVIRLDSPQDSPMTFLPSYPLAIHKFGGKILYFCPYQMVAIQWKGKTP